MRSKQSHLRSKQTKKSGALDAMEADMFLKMIARYPAYDILKEDLESNGLRRPWYETSWKVSLINSVISAVFLIQNLTIGYQKPPFSGLLKKDEVSKKSFLMALGAALVFLPIAFVLNFILTAVVSLLGGELSENQENADKRRLATYLIEKGHTLEAKLDMNNWILFGSILLDFLILSIPTVIEWFVYVGFWMAGIDPSALLPAQN